MSVYFLDIPCSAEVEDRIESELDLSNKKEVFLLYRIHDSGEFAEYRGVYSERESETGDGEYIVIPIQSSYLGKKNYPASSIFVNVKGSTRDHPIGEHFTCWLDYYDQVVGTYSTDCCTDHNIYYKDPTKSTEYNCCNCESKSRKNLVGGHVIFDNCLDEAVVPYVGDVIEIVPICSKHNKNEHAKMMLMQKTTAVQMRYRFPKEIYQTLLEKARNEK